VQEFGESFTDPGIGSSPKVKIDPGLAEMLTVKVSKNTFLAEIKLSMQRLYTKVFDTNVCGISVQIAFYLAFAFSPSFLST